jgi:lipopolysaccharide transport system ATP-binding protein
MSDAAIRVRGLGKQFRIGRRSRPYKTLRETLAGAFRIPGHLIRRFKSAGQDSLPAMIWALKNVTFDVKSGEVIGIIGRNGAGKSTLLKILSRITEPSEGYAEIRGRVGSLLEVGTGFHSELTGGENVYLNGAILGMKRSEITRKFDEIVAFAEVEKFIDTPVKHYSSGMYLRLAFAVAAHLEPDILIVDEVLAVGDARFQKKCLNKMQSVGQLGRTVLFVSHNMPAITRLCERAILLDGGSILRDGPAPEVVAGYLSSGLGTTAAREWPEPGKLHGGEIAGLRAVRVRTDNGRIADTVDVREPVRIEMEYEVWKAGYTLIPYFLFSNEEGVTAFSVSDQDPVWQRKPRPLGRYVSTVWIPRNFLAEGTIFVAAGLETVDPHVKQFFVRDVVAFQVTDSLDSPSSRVLLKTRLQGVVRPLLEWDTEFNPCEQPPVVEASP